MNQHLRAALRFCAYIRSMGGEPIAIQCRSPQQWAVDLQRQHERMRKSVAPEFAQAAKIAARALIRQRGYRRAAEEAEPVQVATDDPEQTCEYRGDADAGPAVERDQITAAPTAQERQALNREEVICRRKLSHQDYWRAILHVRRLGKGVRIYPCFCGSFHVGHPPGTESTQRYRHARRRLWTIEKRLLALQREMKALVDERKALRREVGDPDDSATVVSEVMERFRGLLRGCSWRGNEVMGEARENSKQA